MKRFTAIAALTAAALTFAACSGRDGMIPQSMSPAGQSGVVPAGADGMQVHTAGVFTRVNDDGSVVPYMPTMSDAARARAVAFSSSGSKQLAYLGGKIQPSQKIYLVLWGGSWNSSGDPDKVAPVLKSFLSGLKNSQWESSMTQYYGPVGTHVANAATLAGTYADAQHAPPLHPSDAQVAAEARAAAAHFRDYSIDASYVIAMPHGHDPRGFEGGQYCAYHNSMTASGGTIQYTNLPYIPDAGQNCGAGSVTHPGTDDGVSIVLGHEEAETNTDPIVNPNPTGWYNKANGEIGDECAWVNLQNTKFSSGTFPTQPLWSNKANACVQ